MGVRAAALFGAVLCVAVGQALAASSAVAAPLQFDRFVGLPLPDGAGQLQVARSVAVDHATGQVYVADSGGQRVTRFDAAGNFELTFGRGVQSGGDAVEVCTVAEAPCRAGEEGGAEGAFSGPAGIAVNQTTHDLYVFDAGNRRVQQFDLVDPGTPASPADDLPAFTRAWGWGVQDGSAAFQICTSGCEAGSDGTEIGQFRASLGNGNLLAIGPADGDVFVADAARRIQRFNSNGSLDANPTIGSAANFGPFSPIAVAVDSAGIVYAADSDNGGEIDRYDSAGVHGPPALLPSIVAPPLLAGSGANATAGLAVDPDSDGGGSDVDRLHVLRNPDAGDTVVQQFDSPGTAAAPVAVAETHGAGVFGALEVATVAVNPSANAIYVGTFGASSGHVGGVGYYALDANGFVPGATVALSPADAGGHTATVSGTIDPDGAVQYWFRYSRDGSVWVDRPKRVLGGNAAVAVSDTLSGLEANAPYSLQLVARKVLGSQAFEDASAAQVFVTDPLPPDVTTGGVQQISDTKALVLGEVNANNQTTNYSFEYGLDTGYGNEVPIPAGVVDGGTEETVSAQLTGLQPDTVYHYHLTATNDEGPSEGLDRTFRTRVSIPRPPGDRAFEMVTPPDKNNRRGGGNGADQGFQLANPGQASRDGEAMLYALPAGILDPDAGTAFPLSNDYVRLARDPDQGWQATSIQNIAVADSAATPTQSLHGVSGDFRVLAFWHLISLFPDTQSHLGTRVVGDAGGLGGSGWYDWVGDKDPPPINNGQAGDHALADGGRMVRWSEHLGLLGAGDPSLGQVSGRAIYRQDPVGAGPRDLVNTCTAGTVIPELVAGGLLDSQPCAAGAVTSARGAAVGGGGEDDTGPAARGMSESGKRIFFTSPDPTAAGVPSGSGVTPCGAGGPTGAATDCPPQLFVRQYDSAGAPTVRWVSRPQTLGGPIAKLGAGAYYEGASADGRYVFFRTNAPLTADDPNGGNATAASNDSWDLYRFELAGGIDTDPTGAGSELVRISGGLGGAGDGNTNGTGSIGGAALRVASDDGARAYFVTRRALPSAAADNAPPLGSSDENVAETGVSVSQNATRYLYSYDESKAGAARWKFVARLLYSTSGVDACASRSRLSGMPQIGSSTAFGPPYARRRAQNCVRASSAADQVVFETRARLTSDDTDDAGDVYRYDAAADELVRVSAPPPGTPAYSCDESSSGATVQVCNADLGRQPTTTPEAFDQFGVTGAYHYNVTDDGRVFFESRLALIPEDTDAGLMDVYEWHNGDLSLVLPGSDADHVFYSGNSVDGVTAFVWTTQRIDPREIEDADPDIYAARVGGGFPPPPSPPVLCDVLADGCQGGSGTPIATPTDSDEPAADGNGPAGRRVSLAAARPGRKALRAAARTGVLRVRTRTSKAGTIQAVAKAKVRAGRKLAPRRVAAERRRLRRPGAATLELRLSRAARAALRSAGRLRVTVTVSQSGAAPRELSFVLRRPGR